MRREKKRYNLRLASRCSSEDASPLRSDFEGVREEEEGEGARELEKGDWGGCKLAVPFEIKGKLGILGVLGLVAALGVIGGMGVWELVEL
jgi:hypothetical protein